MRDRCRANSAGQSAQDSTCLRIAGEGTAPVTAASISASLYFSHSIAISPLTAFLLQRGATSRCRSADRAFGRRRDRDAPEIRWRRRDPRSYLAGAGEPIAFRAARADWTNARDRARDET